MITCPTDKLQKVLLGGGCVQNGTPTPDNPIDIVCNNGVLKLSPNLFDKDLVPDENKYIRWSSGGVGTPTSDNCRHSDFITIKENTQYYVGVITYTANTAGLAFYDDTKTYISGISLTQLGNDNNIITSPNDAKYVRFSFRIDEGYNTDWENTVYLVEGNQPLAEFIPYGEIYADGTQEVVTDNLGNTATAEMLLSVGDYKDTQEVLSGKVTRNVGIKVLDGSEDWETTTMATVYRWVGSVPFILPNICTCSHYTGVNTEVTIDSMPNKSVKAGSSANQLAIYIKDNLFSDNSAAFKQYLADQYNAGTPVIIVYPLATSITEQVTPQPLAGNSATITAGSIDNLPIESSTIAELKKRYIGTTPVGRVYIGNNLIWETKEGYGVRWVHGDTSGAVERIGNMEYHRTLPIQSNMRRCIRKENGDIQYISDSDWTKDTNGNTIDYNAEGQDIMVEVPEHYYQAYQKVENGVTYDYLMLYPTVRFGKKVPKHYLGAFKAMLNRDTDKLYSTVKIDTNSLYDSNGDANGSNFTYPANASTYRGGDNDTAYDGTEKTLFGRPVSNISVTNFCTYARNRGDGYALKHWESHWCLWRLFVVEYATLNCQDTFTENLTADGYHQGGLGFGLCSTTDVWSSYNNYNPIAPCGITLRLGSKTGIVRYIPAVPYSNDAYFEVPSYRGVENPFADIWEITNGLYIIGASGKNYIMTADNGWYVRNFNSGNTPAPIPGFTSRTGNKNLGLVQGWPTDFIWDSHGDIIPTVIDTTAANTADTTSPLRDYFWGSNTGVKRAMLGGSLNSEVRAGLACLSARYGVDIVGHTYGSRLLYMPSVSN